MPKSLIWLPDVLEKAGLKVSPVPGWEDRGYADRNMQDIRGVMCHHTATPRSGIMPTLDSLTKGCINAKGKWAPPPLCHLGLGRDGTYFIVAAGRANHAGKARSGGWNGITDGNGHLIGIEAEHVGDPKIPWPEIQMRAYHIGVAAILKYLRLSANNCCGHKEYASPGRKIDPTFDMGEFRSRVAQIMASDRIYFDQIPASEPEVAPGQVEKRPTIRRGSSETELIKAVQKRLALTETGDFDGKTEAAVRQFQREHDLVPDGIIGPKTWRVLFKD